MALAAAIGAATITEPKSPVPALSETIETSGFAFIVRLMEGASTGLTTQIPSGFGHALVDMKEEFKKVCGLDEGVAHCACLLCVESLETSPIGEICQFF